MFKNHFEKKWFDGKKPKNAFFGIKKLRGQDFNENFELTALRNILKEIADIVCFAEREIVSLILKQVDQLI